MANKPHLVNWSIVCLDKWKGGLGIRNLSIFNKDLLGKWSWRFMSEGHPFQKQIIVGKYRQEEGGWCTKEVRERDGVGVWKTIKNE